MVELFAFNFGGICWNTDFVWPEILDKYLEMDITLFVYAVAKWTDQHAPFDVARADSRSRLATFYPAKGNQRTDRDRNWYRICKYFDSESRPSRPSPMGRHLGPSAMVTCPIHCHGDAS
jgi:hypothetical protein